MVYRWLADGVVALHLAFVLFVVFGGVTVLRWRRAAWVHLPVAVWGVVIEVIGFTCPLTPLENWLRARGGERGYAGGFMEHYIMPIVYPAGLTRQIQLLLGAAVLVVNLAIYWRVWRAAHWRRSQGWLE
jgi:hypothetical protein